MKLIEGATYMTRSVKRITSIIVMVMMIMPLRHCLDVKRNIADELVRMKGWPTILLQHKKIQAVRCYRTFAHRGN